MSNLFKYLPPRQHTYCEICEVLNRILPLPLDQQLAAIQTSVVTKPIDYEKMHALLVAKGITKLPYKDWLKLFRL